MHKDYDPTTVQDWWAHQSGFCDKGLRMKELMGPSQVFRMNISSFAWAGDFWKKKVVLSF